MSKHYCGGELKSTALFEKAAPCHQNKQMKHCPVHGTMTTSGEDTPRENDCCNTESELIKQDTEQVELSMEFSLSEHPAVIAVLIVLSGLDLVKVDNKSTHFQAYKPPLVVCDLPVRLQTFLL